MLPCGITMQNCKYKISSKSCPKKSSNFRIRQAISGHYIVLIKCFNES